MVLSIESCCTARGRRSEFCLVSRFTILLLIWFFPVGAQAGKYFGFSPVARAAYDDIISLRLDAGRGKIELLRLSEPDNLVPVFLDNYVDFLTVLLRDDEAEYRRLSKQMSSRLVQLARGDRGSPYYLYTQAEIRLQWAVTHARFNHWLTCMSDIKLAYALLEENNRRFPDFKANLKSLAIIHAMTGSVPDEFKWTLKTFGGIEGSVDKGLKEIEEVVQYARKTDYIFEVEALVLYAYMHMYLNNRSERAWQVLRNGKLDPEENPLAAYALASMALNSGRNEEAIKILEGCPVGRGIAPLAHRDFLLGVAKLNRLDADANEPLERFLRTFTGTINVKEAHQKLAWYHLVRGNLAGYDKHIDLSARMGSERTEGDKSARREALSREKPDPVLLKSRLLFDGGYAQKAYDLLVNKSSAFAREQRYSLEYTYRLARIAHALGRTEEAVRNYRSTMDRGASKPWYYACNAALQLGLLYEERQQFTQARSAYQQCLGIKPEEYRTSLHNRAKAGLNRLRGK